LNRQLAQDIHLLDAEINNYTSPVMKQSPVPRVPADYTSPAMKQSPVPPVAAAYTSPAMKQSPAAAAAVPARSHRNAAAGAPVYRRR